MSKQLALTLDIAGSAQEQGLQGAQNYARQDGGIGVMIGNILSAVMLGGALLCLFFILLGAIEWITSGGDSSKVEGARNKITNAVIGLVVLSATLAIFTLIQNFLGIQFINFQ